MCLCSKRARSEGVPPPAPPSPSFKSPDHQRRKVLQAVHAAAPPGDISSRLLEKRPKQRRWIEKRAKPRKWTDDEDASLAKAIEQHGPKNWKMISMLVPGRNHTQCLQRWSKVLRPGLIKGHWTDSEDEALRQMVEALAEGGTIKSWAAVAERIEGRTSKQCRERWFNHLDPNIKRGNYTAEEDQIILAQQQKIGNRWSLISAMLPGRTEDAVKIRCKILQRLRSGGKSASKQPKKQQVNKVVPEREHKLPPQPKLQLPHLSGVPLEATAIAMVSHQISTAFPHTHQEPSPLQAHWNGVTCSKSIKPEIQRIRADSLQDLEWLEDALLSPATLSAQPQAHAEIRVDSLTEFADGKSATSAQRIPFAATVKQEDFENFVGMQNFGAEFTERLSM